MTSRSGGRSSIALMTGLRRRHARGEPQRRDQARRIGLAGAGNVEGRAVIGRGAHERQAERDVDGVLERERLDRDQRLVVIHADARSRRSCAPRRGTWCRPAAVPGRRCLRARSASIAGATIVDVFACRASRLRRHAG